MKNANDRVARLEARLKKIESSLERLQSSLETALSDLEKRSLLRLRGQEHCRACATDSRRRKPTDPPLSRLEKTFCKANHAVASNAAKRRQRTPLDWEDVERLAK